MEVLIATKNPDKLGEIRAILQDPRLSFRTLQDYPDFIPAKETGSTLEENACLKAVWPARSLGLWTLADDTGLEVEALNGAPGVLSARFSGQGATYVQNNDKLLKMMSGVPMENRSAVFRCVACLSSPEGRVVMERGTLRGFVAEGPRGANGFGYDPIFLLPDQGKTLAELAPDLKNGVSHRAEVLRKMKPHLEKLLLEPKAR